METYSVTCDLESMENLKNIGFDVELVLSKMLSEEINRSILSNVARIGFGQKLAEIKARNREGQIDSILEGKEFIEEKIEDTFEYKFLKEEDKEEYKKNGKISS